MPIPDHVKPRLKVDRDAAKSRLPSSLAATDAEVDSALAAINQDALYDAQRAKMTVEVWDRVSPINGVPADHFFSRSDVDENGDGDIYLVKENGQVVLFQPHDPDLPGHVVIPKGSGQGRGVAHAETMAADRTASEVLTRVYNNILAKRTP